MDKRYPLIGAIVLVLTCGARSFGQGNLLVTPAKASQLDALFATWDNTRSPGCALGVSHDGNIVYSKGYGMANLEYGVAIQPDSIFDVGSVAKQFTAFAITLLASEGKLGLDDDIRRYVPELPDYGQTIRIRHLLTQTSGLRDFADLIFSLAARRPDEVPTDSDVMQTVVRQKALNFAPGAEYRYTNTGFTILAAIVKRVSGQSLREFADARIFEPLGMRDTHFHDDRTQIVPRRASAYQPRSGGGYGVAVPAMDAVGATGLFTSVGDLLKWARNLDDARIGGRSVVDRLQEPGRLTNGTATEYGFGLELGIYRGARTVSHDGADGGYRAAVVRFPDHHLAVTVLCNLSSTRPALLAHRVAETILGPELLPPPAMGPPLLETDLTSLVGTYWNPMTDDVQWIKGKDGQLMFGNNVLASQGGGRFRVGDGASTFVFRSGSGNASPELYAHSLAPGAFVRVAAPPGVLDLREYVGQYHSDELDVTYNFVTLPNGQLGVIRRGSEPVALEMIKADTFGNIGITTFERGPSGEISGFTISTGRVRRLPFRRVTVVRSGRN